MNTTATIALAVVLAAQHAFATDAVLTQADEVHIGHILAENFAMDRGLAPSPQAQGIEKYLQTVGDRVAGHAPRQLPFHFDPDPTFKSAVALPGGEIFLGGGILAFLDSLDSEDHLATVLGHEIGHVAADDHHHPDDRS